MRDNGLPGRQNFPGRQNQDLNWVGVANYYPTLLCWRYDISRHNCSMKMRDGFSYASLHQNINSNYSFKTPV